MSLAEHFPATGAHPEIAKAADLDELMVSQRLCSQRTAASLAEHFHATDAHRMLQAARLTVSAMTAIPIEFVP